MKLNFKQFLLFQGVDRKTFIQTDASHAIADTLYNQAQGIAAHALALKIYNTQGEEEYSNEEIEILKTMAKNCTPAFIDSFEEFIKPKDNDKESANTEA